MVQLMGSDQCIFFVPIVPNAISTLLADPFSARLSCSNDNLGTRLCARRTKEFD